MNWVKVVLVVFPTGLIVTGVASMYWYLSNREATQARSIRYASGLAREINAADLKRYDDILHTTTDQKAVVSFLESSMGPENMGYTVRKVPGEGEQADRVVALDVELTGRKRARDLVLVVADPESAAVVMSTAHAMTGEPQNRSIRFVSAENVSALRRYYMEAVALDERISHLLLLGKLAQSTDEAVLEALHLTQMGTVVERPATAAATVENAQALRARLLELAGRL
jgi:hypothetical protein